jgi:hypothetical protein
MGILKMLDTSRNIGIHIWSHALKPVLYEFQYGKFVSGFMAYGGTAVISCFSQIFVCEIHFQLFLSFFKAFEVNMPRGALRRWMDLDLQRRNL